MKIRLVELFAGYGSQALALRNLGVEFEHYKVVEIDKYAIASYNAIHGTNFKTQDIKELDSLDIKDIENYFYIVTYSFPCGDLSVAGSRLGMGVGTRSGLLWEVERLLNNEEYMPQILVMENVTQVHGTRNMEHFNEWMKFLETKGYKNSYADLIATDFGVPQNRNRTFMVSTRVGEKFVFPKPKKLTKTLKDLLEESVDRNFYLTPQGIRGMFNTTFNSSGPRNRIMDTRKSCGTLCARDYKGPKCVVVGELDRSKSVYEQISRGKVTLRSLTPREYLRLMGLNDQQINKMLMSGNSNTQLYKQAGNSIVVPVLEAIFDKINKEYLEEE